MKGHIFALFAASLLAIGANAHEFAFSCNSNGRVKVHCSDFTTPNASFIRVHINTAGITWGNGTQDTVFASMDEFDLYVPQPSLEVPVSVTFYNQRHEGHGGNICTHIEEQHTRQTSTCNSLPLKFVDFKVEKLNNKEAKVTVVVADVENVQQINIQVSVDGKNYITRAVILPDEGKHIKTYSAIIKL